MTGKNPPCSRLKSAVQQTEIRRAADRLLLGSRATSAVQQISSAVQQTGKRVQPNRKLLTAIRCSGK